MSRPTAYTTDLEGRWEKLVQFCDANPLVTLDEAGLRVAPHALFVFGGDAIDRGPHGRRMVDTLLAAKRAQPDQVVLLAGNRDINKLRLLRELNGHPPARTPADLRGAGRGALLAFIFSHTMGARDALGHRRTELGGIASDDEVADSFLEDLGERGALSAYLEACQLAHQEGETLFVHGAVTQENLGVVPGIAERAPSVAAWIERLNGFYRASMHAFVTRRMHQGQPAWSELVDYQAPLPGTRFNQASVVYGRPTNAANAPALPPLETTRALLRDGVRRVVVGHTPTGDCPTLLRDDDGSFELVMADNSYGRIEGGAKVLIGSDELRVEGETELDSGERVIVRYQLDRTHVGPLGRRDPRAGRLVKAALADGDFVLFRPLDAYRVEQLRAARESLASLRLEAPR